MFVTEAFAQGAATAAGGSELLISILPFVAVFAIMYFLIIRPQRSQMKKREEMLKNIRRGDTVVTGGGIIGKVTKVLENGELEVQISEQTRVRLVQAMVSDVRVKGEPAAANQK
ncbi:protein translocase subunit yajC [Fulvimarina manganoxydans]|uniref:Sec translocon accessory complex subunit YajC n=1 Tax=Fulvimarina manganoxydans TaxID=937218 RepID=A0A1W1YNC0_9HYPH|nr:preprotein translocase subunit YajC [Fulvimarina manganoxydans]MCK5933145.1 preprotein translocase subunit YajC [Fulvimarina manganoxydans]MEE2950584.1 preprotein translocase subunit YajC [Pseudomonadota bacterium]SMC37710.1 protein translocase subunit yajC [Fulvimarina manganoxydans]